MSTLGPRTALGLAMLLVAAWPALAALPEDSAKIVGQVLAERAKSAGISAVVFDRGGYKYHGRVAALAEGAREGGLEF